MRSQILTHIHQSHVFSIELDMHVSPEWKNKNTLLYILTNICGTIKFRKHSLLHYT